MDLQEIKIDDYNYALPKDRIAQIPLDKRDDSKLLVFKDQIISSDQFSNISSHIPENSLLIFNNTKVIPARILFRKNSGALIEIFCLEPTNTIDYQNALQLNGSAEWLCFIGNNRKWKNGKINCNVNIEGNELIITAEKISQQGESWVVKFEWIPEKLSFGEILELTGHTPLPPYITRGDNEEDRQRYQTIYAVNSGSVAAPTAGLHFTENVFADLEKKKINKEYLTLHVGAGTFKPISTSVSQHVMHREPFLVKKDFLLKLLLNTDNIVIPVGTTSVRTLESIYWLGVKLIVEGSDNFNFNVNQWDPYLEKYNINTNKKDSVLAILKFMDSMSIDYFYASTQLMILPTYKLIFPSAIITNFHQPKSTLLLLISAITGNSWKEIYDFAIENDFRFLSYGDSSLLWCV